MELVFQVFFILFGSGMFLFAPLFDVIYAEAIPPQIPKVHPGTRKEKNYVS